MQKNFALFIVVCILIFMGWFWVQQQLWPQRRPDQQTAKVDDAKKNENKKNGDKTKDGDAKEGEKKATKEPEKKTEVKEKPEEKKKPEVKVEPEPAPQTYILGGPDTHLQVVLTTKGAGVQKLTLTRFKAADYLGKPVNRELELIPEDDVIPSYLMYHYPTPNEKGDPPPVLSLGEKTWKFEGQQKNGDVWEIKFSVRVPGQEFVKITKTYRLGPKD